MLLAAKGRRRKGGRAEVVGRCAPVRLCGRSGGAAAPRGPQGATRRKIAAASASARQASLAAIGCGATPARCQASVMA